MLSRGADPNPKDKSGKTPLLLIMESRYFHKPHEVDSCKEVMMILLRLVNFNAVLGDIKGVKKPSWTAEAFEKYKNEMTEQLVDYRASF